MKTKYFSKAIALLLAIVMVFSLLPLSAMPALAAGSGYTGNGTKSDPYVVTTYDGLYAVADFTGTGTAERKYIKLAENINVDRLQSQPIITTLGNCELDLNGKTLKCTSTRTEKTMLNIKEHSKVIINDTSTGKTGCISFERPDDGANTLINLNSGSQLEINGGTYKMNSDLHPTVTARLDNAVLINAYDRGHPEKFDEVEIIINGGSFYSSHSAFGTVSSGSIKIYDGYFECNRSLHCSWENTGSEVFRLRSSKGKLFIYGGHFIYKGLETATAWGCSVRASLNATVVYGGTFEYLQGTERCYGGEFINVGYDFSVEAYTPFASTVAPYGIWKKENKTIEYLFAEEIDRFGYWYVPCAEGGDISLYSPVVLSATIDGVDVADSSGSNIELAPGEHTLRIISKEPPPWFYDAGGTEYIRFNKSASIFTSTKRMRTYHADYGNTITSTMKFNVSAGDAPKTIDLENCAELGKNLVIAGYSNGDVFQNEFHLIKTIKPKAVKLTGITVTNQPTKTTYIAGKSFDSTGMVVKGTYDDGSNKTVTGYTVTNGSNLAFGQTSVTVSYTENGVIKTTTVPITVNKEIASVKLNISPYDIPMNSTLSTAMTVTVTGGSEKNGSAVSGIAVKSTVWTPANSGIYGGKEHKATITLTAPSGYCFGQTGVAIKSGSGNSPFGVEKTVVAQDGKSMAIFTTGVKSSGCAHVNMTYEKITTGTGSDAQDDSREHIATCTDCGLSFNEVHSWVFTEVGTGYFEECGKCNYSECNGMADEYTLPAVRLADSLFYVGKALPTTLKEYSADSDKYDVVGIQWERRDGNPVGTVFEANVEYILTVKVVPKGNFKIDANNYNDSDVTVLSTDTAEWVNVPLESSYGNVGLWRMSQGVWTGKVFGKPLFPAYDIDNGKTSIDVTLPTDIAGKTAEEVFGMITVENARTTNPRGLIYVYRFYDMADLENPVCEIMKVLQMTTQKVVSGDYVFKQGHTYKLEMFHGWGGTLGWEDDNLVIINEGHPDIIYATKLVSVTGFEIEAVIEARAPDLISYVDLTVDAPETGKAPDTTAETNSGANYTAGTPVWTPTAATFAEQTAYSVKIALTANSGYVFADDIFALFNGNTVTVSKIDKTHITVSYSFKKTTSAVNYGDINGDGKIQAADARLCLRASVGLESYAPGSTQALACDVDGNTKIQAADARLILRFSVGLETSFPVENS